MTTRSRIVLAVASLLLLTMYVAPLWRITLEAPQYPEGLGLKIMLSDVQGQKQHDLNNINNLNHYIGMKRIEPDAIPELTWMPWLVGGLLALGLLAAAVGRPWLLYVWCGAFLVLSVAGLVDFWLWAYDYGHNLDVEHAAIKVPGMTYQPPIIGSKQLLNFTAHSWPALGGWAAFASLGIGMILAWTTGRRKPRAAGAVAASALAVLLIGCSTGPQPIAWGEDTDAFCRMTISDRSFASQIVTTTGKAYKFDSIECLRGFLEAGSVPLDEIAGMWVTDAEQPGEFISVDAAHIVSSTAVRSPMGGGFVAFARAEAAVEYTRESGGTVFTWTELDSIPATDASHSH